jgi:2-iminobutanoate/2-iminopropanoate deaminase
VGSVGNGPVSTSSAPEPLGAYSQARVLGEFLFTSGIVGRDVRTGRLPADLAGQVRQSLDNLEAILRAAGGSRASLLSVTCILADLSGAADFEAIYAEWVSTPFPARTTFGADLRAGVLFEIQAWAALVR